MECINYIITLEGAPIRGPRFARRERGQRLGVQAYGQPASVGRDSCGDPLSAPHEYNFCRIAGRARAETESYWQSHAALSVVFIVLGATYLLA